MKVRLLLLLLSGSFAGAAQGSGGTVLYAPDTTLFSYVSDEMYSFGLFPDRRPLPAGCYKVLDRRTGAMLLNFAVGENGRFKSTMVWYDSRKPLFKKRAYDWREFARFDSLGRINLYVRRSDWQLQCGCPCR